MDSKFFREMSDMLTENVATQQAAQLDADQLTQLLVKAGYTDTKLEDAELVDQIQRYVYQIEYYNDDLGEFETSQVGVEVDANGNITADFI